jgi:hypothetical protein
MRIPLPGMDVHDGYLDALPRLCAKWLGEQMSILQSAAKHPI